MTTIARIETPRRGLLVLVALLLNDDGLLLRSHGWRSSGIARAMTSCDKKRIDAENRIRSVMMTGGLEREVQKGF